MKQHIDSFNYFVNTEIEQIVKAKSNVRITSDSDAEWYVQYTAVRVGEPQFEEGMSTFSITPQASTRAITFFHMISANSEKGKATRRCRPVFLCHSANQREEAP